jgi:hypothetical protein
MPGTSQDIARYIAGIREVYLSCYTQHLWWGSVMATGANIGHELRKLLDALLG